MLLKVIVHKFDTSIGIGGHGKDKKVSVIGVLVNKPEPRTNKHGMDTLFMVVSIVKRMCSGVLTP